MPGWAPDRRLSHPVREGVAIPTIGIWKPPGRLRMPVRTVGAMYTTILFIHILAGMAWLGTGIAFQGSVESVLKKEGQVEADRLFERLAWAEKWIFIPMPLLVLATGITMVVTNEGIQFSNLWVIVALSLFVASLILAGGIGGRYDKQLKAHREAGTQASPEHGVLLRSFLRVNAIEVVAILVMVSMMVFRPV